MVVSPGRYPGLLMTHPVGTWLASLLLIEAEDSF